MLVKEVGNVLDWFPWWLRWNFYRDEDYWTRHERIISVTESMKRRNFWSLSFLHIVYHHYGSSSQLFFVIFYHFWIQLNTAEVDWVVRLVYALLGCFDYALHDTVDDLHVRWEQGHDHQFSIQKAFDTDSQWFEQFLVLMWEIVLKIHKKRTIVYTFDSNVWCFGGVKKECNKGKQNGKN